MKKYILISILFLINTNHAQTIDTTKWIIKYIDSLGLSFEYPSYFEISDLKYEELPIDEITFTFLDYEYYERLDGAPENYGDEDSAHIRYLEQPSYLYLILSGKEFDIIGEEYGFTIKDSLWFDSVMLENGWSDEPAEIFNFDEWKGFLTYTPARIYLKGGGCWTAAGEEQRIIAMKQIDNNKYIYGIAAGFDFPEGELIFQMICRSISVK